MKNDSRNGDFACIGSDWPEHEDFLIGNREGLTALRTAIDQALVDGESQTGAGDIVGVRCLDDDFPRQIPQATPKDIVIGTLITVAFLFVIGVGIVEVISWLAGLVGRL